MAKARLRLEALREFSAPRSSSYEDAGELLLKMYTQGLGEQGADPIHDWRFEDAWTTRPFTALDFASLWVVHKLAIVSTQNDPLVG